MLIRSLALSLPLLAASVATAQGFGPPQPIDTYGEPIADLDIADLNSDGLMDLVVSTSTGFFGGGLYVRLATGPGTWPGGPSLVFGDVCATEAVDLDGDGDLDLLCNWDGFICPELVWFENDGTGQSFTLRNLLFCSNDANTCAAFRTFDRDGDGDLDIAATAFGGVVFLEQTAPGAFVLDDPFDNFGLQPASLSLGDFDDDGAAELIAARRTPGGAFSTESWHFRSLDQDGQGVWQASPWEVAESAASQVTWSAGGVGGDELVLHDPLRGGVYFVADPLQAALGTGVEWLAAEGDLGTLSTADLDGDGDRDLVIPWTERGEILWLPNLGGAAVPPALLVAGGVEGVHVVEPGDLNGDGADDLLLAFPGEGFTWQLQRITNFGQPDCNGNGQDDYLDVLQGIAEDCNGNGFLDVCEVLDPGADVNGNGVPDECDLALTSVEPDCGPWHSSNTLTLGGVFDGSAPLQVRIGASEPFDAQVLDGQTAQLQLPPGAIAEVGSLPVTVLQGGLQESLPFSWTPTPALITETTGSLAGGGRVRFFLRNALAGVAWYALDFDKQPAAVPFEGIHHLLELQPVSLAILGSNAIPAQPEGGATPAFEVTFPPDAAPFTLTFRTQVLVVENDGLAVYPAFTNTRTNSVF